MGLGLVVAWLVFGPLARSPWWLAAPAVAFAGLVLAHDRVIEARDRARRIAAVYARGIARLDGSWTAGGATGARFLDPRHLYAADLDLLGDGSLFQLLCGARTTGGEALLAAWLLAPAPPEEVRARQAAVAELRPRLELREALALAGEDVRAAVDAEWLAAWGRATGAAPSSALRWGLAALVALSLATLGVAALGGPAQPALLALVAQALVAWALHARVARTVHAIERPGRALAVLGGLLAILERTDLHAPRLCALRAALDVAGHLPSEEIARLRRLTDLLDARHNQMFIPLGWLLAWTTQLGLAIDAWRARCGPRLDTWLAVVAEMEVLASLAAHAYEHPDDPFPELVDVPGGVLDGAGLGHPLLPVDRCVRNDVALDAGRRLLVVSGSNMSGKSTLLRTVGTNVVLAQLGAPVRARRLRLSPLAIGASIRVGDSLLAGTSRFYAEIKRLRAIVERAGSPPPLLFLLDEILHGTNSHDRRIGAEGVVRALLARGALGLVTTHDLALAAMADALAPRAANVHFADTLDGGTLHFDYRMQPGVVTRSNAIALMRAVGLEV